MLTTRARSETELKAFFDITALPQRPEVRDQLTCLYELFSLPLGSTERIPVTPDVSAGYLPYDPAYAGLGYGFFSPEQEQPIAERTLYLLHIVGMAESTMSTAAPYEGRGLGTSLLLGSNAAITRLIADQWMLFTDYGHSSISAEIRDQSRRQTSPLDAPPCLWTSRLAPLLGFSAQNPLSPTSFTRDFPVPTF